MSVHRCHIWLANIFFVARQYAILSPCCLDFAFCGRLFSTPSKTWHPHTSPGIKPWTYVMRRGLSLIGFFTQVCIRVWFWLEIIAQWAEALLINICLKVGTRTWNYLYIPVGAIASAAVSICTLSTAPVNDLSTLFLMANVVSEVWEREKQRDREMLTTKICQQSEKILCVHEIGSVQ